VDKAQPSAPKTIVEAGPTGFLPGNPMASVDVFIESDTTIRTQKHVMGNGTLYVVDADEVSSGSYVRSVIKFGTGGVSIFIHRADLVRLMVAVSGHLDALDRADAVDRQVAAK
jgi:hypothetical protein